MILTALIAAQTAIAAAILHEMRQGERAEPPRYIEDDEWEERRIQLDNMMRYGLGGDESDKTDT